MIRIREYQVPCGARVNELRLGKKTCISFDESFLSETKVGYGSSNVVSCKGARA